MPEWATLDELDLEVRRDLRGLSKDGAEFVAAHLVAATALADDDPETAWHHARAARARGGRIGVVRETVGLVAYRAGEWAEAIGELRAARRMGGGPGHLAVMADCERALGHPERAIELSRSAEAEQLDPEAAAELTIVVAGARADLGQIDTALAQLERVGLDKAEQHPRLAYAYADLLLKAGRKVDALSWFIRAANADEDEETDALDRVEQLGAELPDADNAPTGGVEEPGESASDDPLLSAPEADDSAGAGQTDDAAGDSRNNEPEANGTTASDPDAEAGSTDIDHTRVDAEEAGQQAGWGAAEDVNEFDNLDSPDDSPNDGPAEVSADHVDSADDAVVEPEPPLTSEPAAAGSTEPADEGSDGNITSLRPEVPSLLFSDDPLSSDR